MTYFLILTIVLLFGILVGLMAHHRKERETYEWELNIFNEFFNITHKNSDIDFILTVYDEFCLDRSILERSLENGNITRSSYESEIRSLKEVTESSLVRGLKKHEENLKENVLQIIQDEIEDSYYRNHVLKNLILSLSNSNKDILEKNIELMDRLHADSEEIEAEKRKLDELVKYCEKLFTSPSEG